MYNKVCIIFCFSLSFQLFAQESEDTVKVLCDEFSENLLKTFDVLRIADNPDRYLMNKSPLSFFDGYLSLYSENPAMVTTYGNSYPYIPYGAEGISEKAYAAIWVLFESHLYLCRVGFPIGKRDDKIVYPPMEKLTGKRFKRKRTPKIENGEWIYGFMPATWFTDTLYVKKANSVKEPLRRDVWQRKHYLRMIFNKGELVSTEVVANKTWIGTIILPPLEKKNR